MISVIKLLEKINLKELSKRANKEPIQEELYAFVESLLSLLKVLLTHSYYRKLWISHGNISRLMEDIEGISTIVLIYTKSKETARREVSIATFIGLLNVLRNLTLETAFNNKMVESYWLKMLIGLLGPFAHEKNIVINITRILSKISLMTSICEIFEHEISDIYPLLKLFEIYKENNYVIMRAAFILANMTTFNEEIAKKIYFDLQGFSVIFNSFTHFIAKANNEDSFYDTMLKSFTSFDFLQQSDKDVLNKVIRLLANMFTDQEASIDFITNRYEDYKFMLRKLKYFMNENEVQNNSELLVCVLSCISNVLYYDTELITKNDFELSSLKYELVVATGYIILQPKKEEILIEGLRVISNLSRNKDNIKAILKIKFEEALIVLLDHRSREIVYYSIGILINLTQDKEFKESSCAISAFHKLVMLLEECQIDDVDIIGCALKALTNIIFENIKNTTKDVIKSFSKLDQLLDRFGEECDLILLSDEINEDEEREIKELRGIINTIINIIPYQEYACPNPLCKRVLKTYSQLEDHIRRLHPTAPKN